MSITFFQKIREITDDDAETNDNEENENGTVYVMFIQVKISLAGPLISYQTGYRFCELIVKKLLPLKLHVWEIFFR